jgi:hypothetical protein
MTLRHLVPLSRLADMGWLRQDIPGLTRYGDLLALAPWLCMLHMGVFVGNSSGPAGGI